MHRLVTGFWKRIVACFLAGLFTILPLVITVAVIAWVGSFIKGIMGEDTVVGRGLQSIGKSIGISFAKERGSPNRTWMLP